MKTRIFAGLLGIVSFVLAANSAAASQIPAGYVLVPAEAFFGEDVSLTAPATEVEISASKSSLRANDEIGFVGENYSTITATLRDETGNPIAGQKVNLVSSRATDTMRALQTATNENGELVFRVLANEEGVSSFTAVAENQTVSERPRIVFLQKAGGIGGNLLRADIAAEEATTAIAANQIKTEFPEQVVVDTPTDITVEIKDSEDSLVEDFAGTISFASSDELAILPKNYAFTELDRGRHTFANAVTFTTAGNQTIDISGDADTSPQQLSVKVLGSAETLEAPVITSPPNGELLNETVSLLGFAEASSNLAVFANGQLFAEGESDAAGRFLIEIELPDGRHEITVAILNSDNSVGATSEAIEIDIDQTPPAVEGLALSPGNKVVTDTLVKINVNSEPELESAQLRVDEDFLELEETESGVYSGEFTAPASGTYLLDLELIDIAGNIGSYPEITSLLVETGITIQTVETAPKNGRVDLSWQPPANHAAIKNYEIFYGTDAENLSQKFTTTDNRTAWFIDQLNNNTTYFFRIISLDNSGKQNGGSKIVSAIPAATITATGCDGKIILEWQPSENSRVTNYRLDYGVESGSYVESRILPNGTTRDEWEVRDLINGVEYFFALRGVDDFGEVVANLSGEASAIPQAGNYCSATEKEWEEETIQLWQREDADGNTILVWNSVAGAASYRVYAGTQPNLFDLPTVDVSSNSTAFRPEGLLANKDYYFAVSAVYPGNHEAATLSNVAKIEVGPAEILLISIALALAGSWLIRRKFARN
ncbi:fibronectin type III domain-containing protein [Patescibacteria group bacterium]|nr:fibronectin type III domain-containing protein [Patescibacteria group bacterium]